MATKKYFWLVAGWRGTKKLFEFKVPMGCYTEEGVKALLRALTAKHALTESEIIGSYARRNTKLNSGLLEVQRYTKPYMFSCGTNPYVTATPGSE